jgi:hypothetical protein
MTAAVIMRVAVVMVAVENVLENENLKKTDRNNNHTNLHHPSSLFKTHLSLIESVFFMAFAV